MGLCRSPPLTRSKHEDSQRGGAGVIVYREMPRQPFILSDFQTNEMPESNSFSRTIRNGEKQMHVKQIFVIVEKRSVKKHDTDSKRKL